MRAALALLLGLALLPSASAANIDLGPATFTIDQAEPGPCLIHLPAPCLAWYDPGGPGIGDDELTIYQSIHRAAIEFHDLPTSLPGKSIDLRNASIEWDIVQRFQPVDEAIDQATPPTVAEIAGVEMTHEAIYWWAPDYNDQNNTVYVWTRHISWNDDFVNATHIHVPYTTYARSTDYFFYSPGIYRTRCPFPFLLDEAACGVQAMHPTLVWTTTLTPNVILGAEVRRADVATTSGPAEPPPGQPESPQGREHPAESPSPIGWTTELEGRIAATIEDAPLRPRPRPALGLGPEKAQAGDAATHASKSDPVPPVHLLLAAALLTLPLLAIILYHRITGARAAEHPRRRKLLALIQHHPGADIATLARALGLSYKSTRHHIEVLQRSSAVRVTREGRRFLVFAAGEERRAIAAAALRHPTRHAVVRVVGAQPGLRRADVARRLGVSRSTLHRHVGKLMRSGLLEERSRRLFLPEAAATHLAEAPPPA